MKIRFQKRNKNWKIKTNISKIFAQNHPIFNFHFKLKMPILCELIKDFDRDFGPKKCFMG